MKKKDTAANTAENTQNADYSAKILLLGKTGTGKSSFINYFLGKDVAISGHGKPVTQEMTCYEFNSGRYPIKIFDTKGLESLNANNQLDEIMETIKIQNNDDNVFNWFHTIFYLVSLADARFQDFERDFIKRLQNELSQHIHIILTHCDCCSNNPEIIGQMKDKIRNDLSDFDNIEIFEVVSVEMTKRNGQKIKPYGKEEISARVFDLLIEDIAYRLSVKYAESLLDSWKKAVYQSLYNINTLINKTLKLKTLIDLLINEDKTYSKFEGYINQIENNINYSRENADKKFNEILQPLAKLYLSYKGIVMNSFADFAELKFDDWHFEYTDRLSDFFGDDKQFLSEICPHITEYSSDDKLNLEMTLNSIGDLLTAKNKWKKIYKKLCKDFINNLPSESEIQQDAYKRIVEFFRQKN